ncbi:MAG: hypothetical protein EZS28_022860 [Streblomastix strix]|uniref:Uncharacterized protein n=1 Tax=Streblomastix strix TaxID=222440 RepID=A0A5J4VGF4_9EUKA|nr:MAG: hypothetical protein EZS28_022860 [Streblomastix strix]
MYTHKDGELVANRVVLPNSKVRIMEKGVQKKEVLHYKELHDWSNAHHLASLRNILGSWNVDLTAKDDHISNTVSQDCTLEAMPIEIADACIKGLKILKIHNDTNTLAREISLLPLQMGLNGLEQRQDKQYKEDAYSTVFRNNILTPNANEHWSDRKGRYSRIDINDPFTFGNISEKATRGEYKEEADIATDLIKEIRYYADESGLVFIIKEYDAQQETNYFVEGVGFNSDNPNAFNVFQGFKYEKLEQVHELKIEMFFIDLIYGTVAGGTQDVFEYILNWIAFIAQNAGQKTRTAIILQGLQRIGKN